MGAVEAAAEPARGAGSRLGRSLALRVQATCFALRVPGGGGVQVGPGGRRALRGPPAVLQAR